MRKRTSFTLVMFAAMIFACFEMTVVAQSNDGKLANVVGGGSTVRWDVGAANAGGSLTITAPDGRTFRRTFRAGASPEISLTEKQLDGLPDGAYAYELRLNPTLSPAAKEALMKARGNDDDPESERAARKRPSVPDLVQSGSFAILNGSIIVGGAVEAQRTAAAKTKPPATVSGNTVTRLRNHRFSLGMMPDDVIADDLIVQGSACVGLDCVNGESFSFDTIRLKENNTRISFNDTSTSAGFPTNDWTIRANDSASGGGNFLAFVDRGTSENGDEVGTIVFRVDAGAAANALRVGSNSKVGLRTATPVLDIHMNTSDTPAVRMEQNASGGFTAQTWDIGANEANFFVRDVTGGSRLPFRVRPGAPTSSVDIAASGNVGIGTASPGAKLALSAGGTANLLLGTLATSTTYNVVSLNGDVSDAAHLGLAGGGGTDKALYIDAPTGGSLNFRINIASKMFMDSSGNVGIGTTAPDQKLSVNGDADKTGGNTWLAFSDERLKHIKGNFTSGLKAVMQLQPIRYEYLKDNALGLKSNGEHIGFGAQAVQKVIPEAVTKNSEGYLMVNGDPILWTMLNAIKEQQKEIAELKGQVRKLQTGAHKRRK
ncbi:MAG: hypothetical protein QOH70_3654 [Blastocatellia bacterium]|nr:hypothetical protein [Blastocatellia bacterium]